jgi:hypothetical protein
MPHVGYEIAQPRARSRGRDPVVARLIRTLRTFVCFPVTFRSSLDSVPFVITSILVLFYAMAPGNNDPNPNLYGAVSNLLKYAFATLLIGSFALLAIVRQRINPSPLFPLSALALSVAGVASFTYSIAVAPGTTTYASALIPLLVAALPLVIPTRATHADAVATTEYLFRITVIAAIFHVLWFLVDYASGLTDADPGSYQSHTFIAVSPVCFMILSGLFRRNVLLVISVGLIVLSVLLRPSSTTLFVTIFATAVIVFYRLQCRRLIRVTCVFLGAAIIVGNLAIFFSGDVAEALYSIEPLVKEDTLESQSNNAFRLGIISALRDEMAEQSMLVGKFFAGDVNVDPRKYLPWNENASLPIHSDYLIMLQQGGLIGYGLLASLLMGMALFCAKAACLAHAAGNAISEILFDAGQTINITYMLCFWGHPWLQAIDHDLFYLILMPLTIFLARAQPGFSGSALSGGCPISR